MKTQRTLLEAEMRGPRFADVTTGSVVFYSAGNPTSDSPNQDAAAILQLEDACILIVADGAGGTPQGGSASRVAIETLASSLEHSHVDDIRRAVLDGIEDADAAVRALGTGAMTTLLILELHDRQARTYNVGDSMALAIGQRGRLKFQTVAHSPVGYAVAGGFLDEDEALHHDERHLVSNMVGTGEARIDIGPVRGLSARDTVILGSDGLFDNLSIPEIVEATRKGPLLPAASRIVELARSRMATEDEDAEGEDTEDEGEDEDAPSTSSTTANGEDAKIPSKPDDLTFILHRFR